MGWENKLLINPIALMKDEAIRRIARSHGGGPRMNHSSPGKNNGASEKEWTE
jgi:hypothetical protein